MKFKNPYCIVRKDLENDKLSVPIWDKNDETIFIHGAKCGWRYRWKNEDDLQIKYNNRWYNAYSIDFDFIG